MTIDTAIVAALIGFIGAIVGGVVVAVVNHYLANRREKQRESDRLTNILKTGHPDKESFLLDDGNIQYQESPQVDLDDPIAWLEALAKMQEQSEEE